MFRGDKRKKNQRTTMHVTSPSSEESVQALRSWVRKIEQSTNSVSSRLAAVEARLTRGLWSSGEILTVDGYMEKSVTGIKNGKRKSTDVKTKDGELKVLSAEHNQRTLDFQTLEERFGELGEQIPLLKHDISEVQTKIEQMATEFEMKTQALEQRKPLVMKFGTMEIPIEVTGIIGGLLAFTIALLVVTNQKAVLLSPVFLTAVGVLLIGSAMFKMLRARSKAIPNPRFSVVGNPSTSPLPPMPSNEKS